VSKKENSLRFLQLAKAFAPIETTCVPLQYKTTLVKASLPLNTLSAKTIVAPRPTTEYHEES
jgi:hypothetical protein